MKPFHLDQKFLIVLTKSAKDTTATLHNIFSIISDVGLFNVNVLIENQQKAFWSLHFYRPYARDCYGFTVVEIDRFLPQNYTNPFKQPEKKIFPSKVFKFRECPLYVATFPMPPFVIIENSTNETDQFSYDGIDIILVNHISRTLNLKPKYIQSSEANQRGMVFSNGTATGAFGLVWMNECLFSKIYFRLHT